jgi:hypothetical protein
MDQNQQSPNEGDRKMSLVAMLMLVLGVAVSMVSGLVCYVGGATLSDSLEWLPQSQLILLNPEIALTVGGLLVLASFIFQPSRLQ